MNTDEKTKVNLSVSIGAPSVANILLAFLFLIGITSFAAKAETPAKVFSITNYGAIADGKTDNTVAITQAIAACKKAGGGELLIPAGRFLTGPLSFCSNLTLHLDGTLLLQNDIANYPKLNDHSCQNGFTFDHCRDITITGPGAIDGQGQAWWEKYHRRDGEAPHASAEFPHRPDLLSLKNCHHVLIENITLENSPMFHLVPQACEDVTIRNITIHAPEIAPNTDGIDPSGKNFTITHCHIDTGDDCIAIKPSGQTFKPSCQNFTITDCTFLHGHGLSIGGQTPGGLRHLVVRDCTFDGTDAGIRMKAHRGAGGLVEDLDYENLSMKNVKVAILITSYYPKIPKAPQDDPAQPINATTPIWRHIRITNVNAENSQIAAQILGLPEMPVEDVTFTHVDLSAARGMQIAHARGIHFVDCKITAETGPNMIQHDAQITGLR